MKREPPMTHDAFPRSADPIEGALPIGTPGVTPHVRPLGGRRISFLAWGLACLAGILIWTLIFKLI